MVHAAVGDGSPASDLLSACDIGPRNVTSVAAMRHSFVEGGLPSEFSHLVMGANSRILLVSRLICAADGKSRSSRSSGLGQTERSNDAGNRAELSWARSRTSPRNHNARSKVLGSHRISSPTISSCTQ